MIASLFNPKKRSLIDRLGVESSFAQNGNAAPALANGIKSPKTGAAAPAEHGLPSGQHLLSGGTLTAIAQRVQQETLQPLVAEVTALYTASQTAPLFKTLGEYLTALDDKWQMFVHTQIDPLLGGERSQQLSDLGIQLSPAEKDINRRLILAVGNVGVALAATHLFLPLALANVAFSTWIVWPVYQRGYQMLVKEHRLTYPLVLFGAELAIYLGGNFIPGSVVVLIITATNKLINRTENHFRRELVGALGQQPRTVWKLIDGAELEIPFAAIGKDDILVISGGETIAVDGVIVTGVAAIDQHRLTGEAQPAEKGVGDPVFASTTVLSGKIQVQVQKTGAETSAAQIAVILQRVTRARISFTSSVQNFVDGMTLPMLALGGTALLTLGSESAAAILGVGVGSVARFGGPIAMLNYLNAASQHGLLIKDARSLETLKRVDTVVFDKTGTLTLERPQVSQVHVCQDLSEDLLLTYTAAAESKQSHPIAKAIIAAAQARNLTLPAIEDAHLEVGYGIKVRLPQSAGPNPQLQTLTQDAGHLIRVGSSRFMEMEGIAIPAVIASLQETCYAQGHSLVMVAVDEQFAGAIELQPTIRPEAQRAIAALRQRGLALYIISGDHEAPTARLAQALGIEHYFAGVLPQDKAKLVEQLKADGRTVCFVGDGINDALALGKADVSVSLRGATTLATDTAQIVLMNQDLGQLEFLLKLAHEFDGMLRWLFRLTYIPVSTIVLSTFLLHTGMYVSVFIWQLGVLGGIGLGFLPLLKYGVKPAVEAKNRQVEKQQPHSPEVEG